MKFLDKIAVVLCALGVFAGANAEAYAQEPVRVVGAGFEPSEVLIGDHFRLNIDVEAEDGCEVAFPTITEEFAGGHIELLEEIATEGKPFPVECQFCDAVYEFTPEDIEELLKKI